LHILGSFRDMLSYFLKPNSKVEKCEESGVLDRLQAHGRNAATFASRALQFDKGKQLSTGLLMWLPATHEALT